jgi:hypothetical protein
MRRMTKLKTYLAFAVASLLVPAVASAEPMRKADRVHDLHSTDRLTPVSSVAFEAGYLVFDDDTLGDPTVFGFDVAGHVVTDSGAGGYVVLPLAFLSYETVMAGPIVIFEGDSEVALGNIEVGGLYSKRIGRNADLIVHGGVGLPTADDDGVGALQSIASTPRYGELVQRVPNATWLRLGVSPMGTAGPMFWRVDVGVDLALAEDDDAADTLSPVLRVNLAGGIDLGPADVSAELVTNVVNPENDEADETASTLTIGTRFDGESIQPGFGLIIPVGFDDIEDTVDLAIAFSLVGHMK